MSIFKKKVKYPIGQTFWYIDGKNLDIKSSVVREIKTIQNGEETFTEYYVDTAIYGYRYTNSFKEDSMYESHDEAKKERFNIYFEKLDDVLKSMIEKTNQEIKEVKNIKHEMYGLLAKAKKHVQKSVK